MTDAQRIRAEVYQPALNQFHGKGAVMQIDGQPLPEAVIVASLEIVRMGIDYDGEGNIAGSAVWLMVKPIGYEIDFESVKNIRAETWADDDDALHITDAEGRRFTFTVPEGFQAGAFATWRAERPDTDALDAELLKHHRALAMKWDGVDVPEEFDEDETEATVNP